MAKLGTPAMPHQQLVTDIGFEIIPETGLPAYRAVVMTFPRQTGKTSTVLGIETERCVVWKLPQKVLYTAQTGSDAREKLVEDQLPILQERMGRYLLKPRLSNGKEAIRFRNGSRIVLTASSEKSGHGGTIDLGVLDECFADQDNRREQTILPMIKTKPLAQILICSTVGDEKSVYLNRIMEIGRAAAAADKGHGIAYFEYSVPEDADFENPAVWWEFMPGLGYTITEDAIRYDFETMELEEFKRADCNIRKKASNERVIPEATWEAVQHATADVKRDGKVCFGIAVHPERNFSAIGVSDGQVCGLIDHREGTGWIEDRARQIHDRWGGKFVVDGGGPAASIADDLVNNNKVPADKVEKLTTPQMVAACSRIYDNIADMRIMIRRHERLDIAVAGLAKRPVGDRFVWDRRVASTDITPFEAITLALSGSPEREVLPLAAWS